MDEEAIMIVKNTFPHVKTSQWSLYIGDDGVEEILKFIDGQDVVREGDWDKKLTRGADKGSNDCEKLDKLMDQEWYQLCCQRYLEIHWRGRWCWRK